MGVAELVPEAEPERVMEGDGESEAETVAVAETVHVDPFISDGVGDEVDEAVSVPETVGEGVTRATVKVGSASVAVAAALAVDAALAVPFAVAEAVSEMGVAEPEMSGKKLVGERRG